MRMYGACTYSASGRAEPVLWIKTSVFRSDSKLEVAVEEAKPGGTCAKGESGKSWAMPGRMVFLFCFGAVRINLLQVTVMAVGFQTVSA
jgi:hypothetical protein